MRDLRESDVLFRYVATILLFLSFRACTSCFQVDSMDFEGALAFSIALAGDLETLSGLCV